MALHVHDRPAFAWHLPAGVVLVALLATLATFQYRWLGEVSEAERARMKESLRGRATEFTQEFDRELTRMYLGFHVDSDLVEKDPGGTLADALGRTQATAATSGLIKAVFLLDAQGPHAGVPRKLDVASRTLQPSEWPAALDAWRSRTAHLHESGAGMPPPFFADAVDAEIPALIVPLPRMTRIEDGSLHTFTVVPDPSGLARAVIVWLDADRLQRQLLEPLVAKYFGAGDTSEYIVAIVKRDDPSRVVYSSPAGAAIDEKSADVTTGLFDLRMEEVNRIGAGPGVTIGPRRSGAPPTDRAATDRVAITIVRRSDRGDGMRVLMTGGDAQGAWQVRARHRSGSLEAIVAQSRRRNLAISLGVLGLLGASFLLVIAAALRQQRLARQQMEFVAAVSHELRTPLAVICSAGENLADGVVADGQQVKRYGSLIGTEGRRLGDMVERVLQFAGISSGAHTHATVEVDLGRVIADAVNSVAADARDRGVAVAVRPHAPLPPIIGDADALRSALQNIVGNGVKYSPGGGSVDVIAEVLHDGGVVRIRVVDRGLGIDASDLPHLFKPFYRGRRAVDAQVRGTGVGLSVVQHVIFAHGGDVRIDSRVGEGTTVTVLLPAMSASDLAEGRLVRIRRGAAGAAW